MEQLVLGWAGELAKQGGFAIVALLFAYGYWRKDQEVARCNERHQEELNKINQRTQTDLVKVALALENSARAIAETTEVTRQKIDTDRLNSKVLEALIKQQDILDARSKERQEQSDKRNEEGRAEVVRMFEQAMRSLSEQISRVFGGWGGSSRGS